MTMRHQLVLMMLGLALCAGSEEILVKPVPPLVQSKPAIKVAAVQMNTDPGMSDPEALLALFAPYIERAGEEKVDLLVFPEYVLGNFKIPDAKTEGLCALARKHQLNLVVGGWEFLDEHPITAPVVPGTYANSALIINREGEIVARHHKMYAAIGDGSPYFWPPSPGELGENTMVPGPNSPVVDLDFGRIAVLTCYDGYFFPSFEIPALQGAEVLVWINGRGGAVEEHIVRAASFMTCTHVVATNQSVGAGTQICSYPGQILDITKAPGDAYISGELDLDALRVNRRNNRMFHQRRPELNQPLIEGWQPWTAYPDIPLFEHAE
jgi:predicted amidohydrolase